MVLIRLRCGLPLADLALGNHLGESIVSRIFTTWIDILYFHLYELCRMPDHWDDLGNAEQFSTFPDLKVVIDCTAILVQKPSSLKANKEVYQQYCFVFTALTVPVDFTSSGTILLLGYQQKKPHSVCIQHATFFFYSHGKSLLELQYTSTP